MADIRILGSVIPTSMYKPRAEMPQVLVEHSQADLETHSDVFWCFVLIINSTDFAWEEGKSVVLCMNM